MADALKLQLEQVSTYEVLAFTERLSLLVDHEILNRDQNRQAKLVRLARFKLRASIQDIDYRHRHNIKNVKRQFSWPVVLPHLKFKLTETRRLVRFVNHNLPDL